MRLVEENARDAMYSLSVTQSQDTLTDLDVKCHRRSENREKKVGRWGLKESMFTGSLQIGFFF